jgi:ATP-dependent helicase HrpA
VSQASRDDVRAVRARLDGLTIRDAARLGRRLKALRAPVGAEKLAEITRQVAAAEAVVAARVASLPEISYPDLPVSQFRAELAAAIAENQVVVVAGATGSGKTTQLPKICLELGRGVRGTIGHTQPRRLAARTVAERIASELGTPVGEAVGYSVRFTDQVSDRTLIKLMTDGVLLAEIQRDRSLLRYDTLILDEAHERSLNIDFLLGYLRQLLPRRPDLKVIVTSATIEPERFAAHFGVAGPAPIVEVSGRTYPVEIRYRPLELTNRAEVTGDDPDDPDHEVVRVEPRDQTEAIIDALAELSTEPPGDVLVFLSGEREIRDTAEAVKGALKEVEVLPLYARLPTVEQHKVFIPNTSRLTRRVVLATNVAETSLTVPGIHYVIDPGTARISRYSRRTKVQRLPIEPISQASAAQRAGRSGRTAPGVCIRLYSEQDFADRPLFTDPEILRTNLASVILQMAALRLGDVQDFPFLDPPDRRSINDGVQVLQELGAFDAAGAITDLGRRLSQLPVDPRLGRMILQSDSEGCLREVLVLAAALSIPDPRERPIDREEAARQQHARFADEHSDFMSFLNLWRYLQDQRKALSGSAFRRMCRDEFLHYLRIREWQDLAGQLRGIAAGIGLRVDSDTAEPADPARVHAALAAGLLSHIGLREGESREYLGARNARFVLAPGSALTKRPPRWIMVADLVETSRLYGRIAARIEPDIVERIAGHLVQRSYSEPHWDATRGAVLAFERVTLFGIPLVARRRVGYAAVEPEVARDLFIRHALVEGDWQTRHHFFADNARLRTEVAELEERARRRDLLVGEPEIYNFYDTRIPADVVSARHFDGWWRKQRHRTPDLLTMTRADLLRVTDAGTDRPDRWESGDLALPLTYRFEPGSADDGVTVHVPVGVLARLGGQEFGWQVPALREELITALIKSLPKDLRRNFVPAPDTARALLEHLQPGEEPLLETLQRELHRRSGILVPLSAFDLDKLPPHLRVTFAVEAPDGAELARGKDLAALQQKLAGQTRRAVADAVADGLERRGLRDWPADLDGLPSAVQRGGVRGYPGLIDTGSAVDLRVFSTASERDAAMRRGQRRLLRMAAPSPVKSLEKGLDTRRRLMLGGNPDGSVGGLLEDCADAAVDVLVPAPVRTRADYDAARQRVHDALRDTTAEILRRVEAALTAYQGVLVALPDKPSPMLADAVADIRAQLADLVGPGFVARTGAGHLSDLTRYLTAIVRRIDKLAQAPVADRERMDRVAAVRQAYSDLLQAISPSRAVADDVIDIARMIQEFRVSLWAQQLGTPRPVSEQRIYRAIDAVLG